MTINEETTQAQQRLQHQKKMLQGQPPGFAHLNDNGMPTLRDLDLAIRALEIVNAQKLAEFDGPNPNHGCVE